MSFSESTEQLSDSVAGTTDVGVVLVAAGESNRLRLGKRKPYLELKGREVFLRSIDIFSTLDFVSEIVLVVNEKDRDEVEKGWGDELERLGVTKIIKGGRTRQESVRKGVLALSDSCKWVAIHDAVRPFVRAEAVVSLIETAKISGSAILSVPMKETVKESKDSHYVSKTVPRASLWLAQTPQMFPKEKYLEVAKLAIDQHWETTDDAQLFELAKLPVAIVEGSYDNIKVTTEADWRIAQAMIESWI